MLFAFNKRVTTCIHRFLRRGDRAQGQREKALSDFKADRVRVLVATDAVGDGASRTLLPPIA